MWVPLVDASYLSWLVKCTHLTKWLCSGQAWLGKVHYSLFTTITCNFIAEKKKQLTLVVYCAYRSEREGMSLMTGTLKLSSQTDPNWSRADTELCGRKSEGKEGRREGRGMRGGEQMGRRGNVNRRGGQKDGDEQESRGVRREEGWWKRDQEGRKKRRQGEERRGQKRWGRKQ